jgi:LPXTG-site transpeptidase (sortase) family protein
MRRPLDKKVRLLLGLLLIFSGLFIAALNYYGEDIDTSATFENEPVKIELTNNEDLDEASLPVRIIIPDLGIDLDVQESKIVNGYWEVPEDKAAWGEGSGVPGKDGNQVIFAHAREGLFSNLENVEKEMHIYVLTDRDWFTYEVSEIKEVYPNDTEVIAPTENERLTLYTCSGYKDSKRLIVVSDTIE